MFFTKWKRQIQEGDLNKLLNIQRNILQFEV